MRTIRVPARIDLDDVLEELTDEQLLKVMEQRRTDISRTVEQAKEESLRPMLEDALDLLRRGRVDDATLCLERALFPKWKSPEEAFARLLRAQS